VRDDSATGLDAGDAAAAEEDERHGVFTVEDLGFEGRDATDRAQRHGTDLTGDTDRLAVTAGGDRRTTELVDHVSAELFGVKFFLGCGDLPDCPP
jgi:hypothetical protein